MSAVNNGNKQYEMAVKASYRARTRRVSPRGSPHELQEAAEETDNAWPESSASPAAKTIPNSLSILLLIGLRTSL